MLRELLRVLRQMAACPYPNYDIAVQVRAFHVDIDHVLDNYRQQWEQS
jgi:hypothetical protein